MEQTDQLILDTAHRLFTEQCGADVVNGAESGAVPEKLVEAVAEAGLALAWVSEERGGVGGSLELGFGLIRQAAGFALPVPLAEALLANLVLAESGLDVSWEWPVLAWDGGELPVVEAGQIQGVVNCAPGVSTATLLVVPVSDEGRLKVATFHPEDVRIEHRESLAGESRGRMVFDGSSPVQISAVVDGMTADGLRQFCALVRAAQIAGAMEKISELTVSYVSERKQFGRPLGKFQAIQHMVADIASESALASAAVEQAVRVVAGHPEPLGDTAGLLIPVATAKVVTSEGAGKVARNAHQAHGAMGFSFEYPLQQYTRRIWGWREEFGAEFDWSERLGMAVAVEIATANGPDVRAWDIISR